MGSYKAYSRAKREIGRLILTASIGIHNKTMTDEQAASFLVDGARSLLRQRGMHFFTEAWFGVRAGLKTNKFMRITQQDGREKSIKLFYAPLEEYIEKLITRKDKDDIHVKETSDVVYQ